MKIYTINPGLQFIKGVDPHLSSEDSELLLHDLNVACFYVLTFYFRIKNVSVKPDSMLHLQFVPLKQVTLNTKKSFSCFSETFTVLHQSDRTAAVAVFCEWGFRLETCTPFWLNPDLSSSRSVCDLIEKHSCCLVNIPCQDDIDI